MPINKSIDIASKECLILARRWRSLPNGTWLDNKVFKLVKKLF